MKNKFAKLALVCKSVYPASSFIIVSIFAFVKISLEKESFSLYPFVKKDRINGGLRAPRVTAYVMKSHVIVRDLIGRRSRGNRSGQSKNERRACDLIELNASAERGGTLKQRERERERKRERERQRTLIDKV